MNSIGGFPLAGKGQPVVGSNPRLTMNRALNQKTKFMKANSEMKMNRKPGLGSDVDRWLKALEEDQIARRAREIYQRNGAQPGRDLENWLQAEVELKRELDQIEVASEPEIVITATRTRGGQLRVKSLSVRTPRTASGARKAVKTTGSNNQN